MSHIIYSLDKVASSLISKINWKDTTPLYITFRTNNLTYAFKNVPKNIVMGLVSAESVGKYFNKNIKNKYDYTIVEKMEY